jgi:hypothetical protein
MTSMIGVNRAALADEVRWFLDRSLVVATVGPTLCEVLHRSGFGFHETTG